MSNLGQVALTATGTAIGAYLGGPIGARVGFLVGNISGQLLFPTKLAPVEGPRLTDAPQPVATVGTPLALTYGTGEIQGVCVWMSVYTEHEDEEQAGGKGGPEQTQRTYTYTRSYAIVCGARPKAALLALRRNTTWEYDVRPQRPNETTDNYNARIAASAAYLDKIEIYLGTSTQMPSPTIEGIEGVGNVPAYRGRPYIVFIDDDVTANRTLPADVVTIWVDAAAEEPTTSITWSPADSYPGPWAPAMKTLIDPRHEQQEYRYKFVNYASDWRTSGTWRATVDDALVDANASISPTYSIDLASAELRGWTRRDQSGYGVTHGADGSRSFYPWSEIAGDEAPESPEIVGLIFSRRAFDDAVDGSPTWLTDPACPGIGAVWYRKQSSASTDGSGVWANVALPGYSYEGVAAYGHSCDDAGTYRNPGFGFFGDVYIVCQPIPSCPANPCDASNVVGSTGGICIFDDGSTAVDAGYESIAGTYRQLAQRAVSNDADKGEITQLACGPVLRSDDPDYSSSTFWEPAYLAAVSAGAVPAGWTYGVQYPVVVTSACKQVDNGLVAADDATTLDEIITDLAMRSGLQAGDIDVTAGADVEVDYLLIASTATARQVIESLQAAYGFDLIDAAGTLTIVMRGGAIVRSYSTSEVGAVEYGNASPDPRMTPAWAERSELPSRVIVRYLSVQAYAPRTQRYGMQTPDSAGELTYDFSLALYNQVAYSLARRLWTQIASESETYTTTIGPRELVRLPGDIIELPIDGQTTRARITSISGNPLGVLTIQAVRDDVAGYEPSPTAVREDDAPTSTASIPGPTELLLLDLPVITSADDNAGYRAAVRGYLSSWTGAKLQRSVDAGGSYSAAVSGTMLAAPIGETIDALPASGPWTWDRSNTLTFAPRASAASWESRTEAEVLGGYNLWAYEVRNVSGATLGWELCQHVTRTVNGDGSVTLSQLLRGRRGTEWAIGLHSAGDRVVLLGSAVKRVATETNLIGAELLHRAVSIGNTPSATEAISFTPEGVALECLAPTYLRGERDGAGNLALSWLRRSRTFDGIWRDGLPVPLGEDSERYDIEILDGTDVVRTLTVTSPTATYTAAQQTTDFGGPQATVAVRIYQVSATVGRGYPAEANL